VCGGESSRRGRGWFAGLRGGRIVDVDGAWRKVKRSGVMVACGVLGFEGYRDWGMDAGLRSAEAFGARMLRGF